MTMKKILIFIILPLLYSCQQYNKPPYDDKEKEIRKLPDSMKKINLQLLRILFLTQRKKS